MRISWCFSFLNWAGGSARSLVLCPKVLALTRQNGVNCSSSSGSYLSSVCGPGLLSHLPFLLSSGLLPDPSPSSSGSPLPPPPAAPAALPCGGGGGGFPPPATQASGVGSDTFPFPFTCPINVSTIGLSSEISPSRTCCPSFRCHSTALMRRRLISWFSSSLLCCLFNLALSR